MVLPLYLAMTGAEMSAAGTTPHFAWMACHFSPYGQGLTNIPRSMPEGSMLILNDRVPCQGHSASLAAQQLAEAADRFACGSVLLDFQRPVTPETAALAEAVLQAVPCPAAISDGYAGSFDCAVFLPPCPLHMPLEEYLAPWRGRELWVEAALCQEQIRVTPQGTAFSPRFPPEGLEGGFAEEELCCRYITEAGENEVRFTLFDTPETLVKKLDRAGSLGVIQAVGLYQQLRPHLEVFLPSMAK